MSDRPIRRLTTGVILLVALGALVATSPPSPPVSHLEAEASGLIELTADEPVASTRITVDASDEALWSDDPEIQTIAAELRVLAQGAWKAAEGASPTPDTLPTNLELPTVRLRLVPPGGPPVVSELGFISLERVDLLAACTEGLDCTVEMDAIIEWVDPVAGETVSATLAITAESQIQGPEAVPVGATIELAATPLAATDAPVRADTLTGSATLDAEHPLVSWTIDLEANAAAVPALVGWPIESRGTFLAAATMPGGDDPDGDGRRQSPPLQLLLFTDDGTRIELGYARPFDPFLGCTVGAPCSRTLTVVARWFAQHATESATVDWRMNVGLVYHGDEVPGPGARVTAATTEEVAIGPEGPSLDASLEGTITFDGSDGGLRASDEIVLTIPAEALASALVGGPVPALTGVVAVEGTTARAVEGELPPLLVRWGPEETLAAPQWDFPEPLLNGDPVTATFYPAVACRPDAACQVPLTIEAGIIANDVERLTGNSITVRWRVDVSLRYPTGTRLPPGIDIELSE